MVDVPSREEFAALSKNVQDVATTNYSLAQIIAQMTDQISGLNKQVGTLSSLIPAPVYRDPVKHPFAADNPFNTALSTKATYAAATEDKTALLRASASKAWVNRESWSVGVSQASETDPVVTLKHPTKTTVWWKPEQGYKIAPGYNPPPGTGTHTPDAATILVQPNGYTAHDAYKVTKVDDKTWTSTFVVSQDLRGSGISNGCRAAGISYLNGLIRTHWIDAVLAGELEDFPQALALSIPMAALKLVAAPEDGQVTGGGKAVWPANRQDTQQGSMVYTGIIPMGTHFALRKDFNVDTLMVGSNPATPVQKALARTLQRRGMFVTDQSSSWSLYAEPTSNAGAVSEMRAIFKLLMAQMLRVTNNRSDNVGGGPAPRLAEDPAPFDPKYPAL